MIFRNISLPISLSIISLICNKSINLQNYLFNFKKNILNRLQRKIIVIVFDLHVNFSPKSSCLNFFSRDEASGSISFIDFTFQEITAFSCLKARYIVAFSCKRTSPAIAWRIPDEPSTSWNRTKPPLDLPVIFHSFVPSSSPLPLNAS